MAAVGASVGISFVFDRIARTPNTFDAHRLIGYAQTEGKQHALVESLFRAYSTEGRDIGAAGALRSRRRCDDGMGRSRGLPGERSGAGELHLEEERGRRLGINSVPFFLIDRQVALSGAHEPEVIVETIEKALQRGDV